jgi:outer membrane protein assembly factor BamB
MKRFDALFVVCALTMPAIAADDLLVWPQFRGPGGSGIAENQSPPVEIGPDKNVKWKVPAPSGLSSPIVVGDKLVITAFDDGSLYTIAYNRADGSEAWRAEAPAKKIEAYYSKEGSPAASTCATDGEHIVSYFGSCGLFCYNTEGKELWKHEMPTAETAGDFGSGTSPIIADGKVVLVRDVMADPTIIALDAKTGDVAWQKPRKSKSGYSTPVVWNTPAGKQVATAGFARLIGYDLATGDEKWFVEGMPSGGCASPVVAGGNLFYAGWAPGDPSEKQQFPSFDQIIKDGDADGDGALSKEEAAKTMMKNFFNSSDANKDGKFTADEAKMLNDFMAASRNSAFMLTPGGMGDAADHVRWKKKEGLPYVPSAIVYDGQYVMVKDGGIVTAYDADSGEQIYQKRAVESGGYYASPVAANGNIYFTSLADGTVTVIKGGEKSPQVVAKNPPLGERVAATPAVADDTLYIRGEKHLYAFSEM